MAEPNIASGIYAIRCTRTGQQYIGSAVNIIRRWVNHRYWLQKKKHHSYKLQKAWNAFGEQCFEFVVLEFCSKELLVQREQIYLDLHEPVKNGFNVNPVAGSCLGRKQSKETRLKISAAKKGRSFAPEHRQKLSKARKGRALSPKHKRTLSLKIKGRKMPDSFGKKISTSKRGKSQNSNFVEFTFLKPDGSETSIVNLCQFCRENDMSRSGFRDVINGKRTHYRGWRFVSKRSLENVRT